MKAISKTAFTLVMLIIFNAIATRLDITIDLPSTMAIFAIYTIYRNEELRNEP